jgi:hypothetical protein
MFTLLDSFPASEEFEENTKCFKQINWTLGFKSLREKRKFEYSYKNHEMN